MEVKEAKDMLNGMSFASIGSVASLKPHLLALNVQIVLLQLPWRQIEPIIYPTPIYNWVQWDKIIEELPGRIVLVVGQGDNSHRPVMPDGGAISPDTNDAYIEMNTRMVANIVKRYKYKVHDWCILAEANEYPLRIKYGWLDGYKWEDYAFLTLLGKKSYEAIKSSDNQSNVIIMFHTDIHSNIHHDFPTAPGQITGSMLAGKYDWLECAELWQPYYDTLGIDTYPNYYGSDPVYSDDIRTKINLAKKYEKSVWITETQYPFSKLPLPSPVEWTEAKQGTYIREAYQYAKEAGAEAFCLFNFYASGVTGLYEQFDLDALTIVGKAFRNGDARALLNFLFSHYGYCINTLGKVLQKVESGLGISNSSAYEIVRELYKTSSDIMPVSQFVLKLKAGWSLISFPINKYIFTGVAPDICPLGAELVKVNSLKDWLNSIIFPSDTWDMVQDATGAINRTLPDQFDSIKSISSLKGYWIKMNTNAVLRLDGKLFIGPIQLKSGWNLISFPSMIGYYDTPDVPAIELPEGASWKQVPQPVGGYILKSIAGKYTNILSSSGAYNPAISPEFSSLHYISPGSGYWINAKEDCELKII